MLILMVPVEEVEAVMVVVRQQAVADQCSFEIAPLVFRGTLGRKFPVIEV